MKSYRLRRLLFPGIILYVVLTGIILGWFSLRSVRDHLTEQGISTIREHALLLENVLTRFTITSPDVSPEDLQQFILATGSGSSIRITLIDSRGIVLADSEKDPALLDNHRSRFEVSSALEGIPHASVRFSESLGYDMIYYALPVELPGGPGVLRTAFPLKELGKSLRTVYRYFSIGIVLFLAIALLFAYLLLSKIERPMAALARWASQFSRLEFDTRPPEASPIREIHVVAGSLHAMARELREQFSSIQHQRDELKAVLDSMSEAVIVLDENLTVLETNPSANRFFSRKQKDLSFRPIQSVIKSPELYDIILETTRDGMRRSSEIFLKQSCYHVNVTSLPVSYGSDKRQILLVCNDITTLMHLERVRRDFVANVSHELKTPITSIKGFSETLLDGALEDQESSKRFLQIIHRQSLRLHAIIDDLLTLSQLEQKMERAQFTSSVLLLPMIEDVVLICREKNRQLGRPIDISCPASLSAKGNGHLIEQAMINLLENAMKYSEPASLITITCSISNTEISVSVTDRGYGIPEQEIPRIFERFYRVDKARSRDKGGTGLGLSIVKHIMLQHRGSVDVVSREGEGTICTLRFPAIE